MMLKKTVFAVAILLGLQAPSAFAWMPGSASGQRACLNYLKTFHSPEQMKTTLENKEYYLWYYQYGGSALRAIGWAATAGMAAAGQVELAPVGAAATTLASTVDGWFESESFYVDCLAQAMGEPTDPKEYVRRHFGELPPEPAVSLASPDKTRVPELPREGGASVSNGSTTQSGSAY